MRKYTIEITDAEQAALEPIAAVKEITVQELLIEKFHDYSNSIVNHFLEDTTDLTFEEREVLKEVRINAKLDIFDARKKA